MPHQDIKEPKNDKELIDSWSLKLRRGISFRQRIHTDAEWDRYEGYFRNRFLGKNHGGLSEHHSANASTPNWSKVRTDNTMTREARKMVPKIVFGTPYVKIKPLAGRTPLHAKVLERAVNGVLDKIKIGETLDRGALSVIQHGTTFFKPIYDAEYVPSYENILTEGFSEGAFDKKGKRREYRQNVFPGMPGMIWQHPKGVIFPEMISNFEDAPWVAYQYLRPIEDVRNDERLSSRKQIQPTSYRLEGIDPFLSNESEDFDYLKDQVLMTEVRDKRTGMMYIFAESHSKIVYKEKDVLMSVLGGKLPNYSLAFNDNTDYAWGSSDIHMVEEDMYELMDIRSQHAINRRLRNLMFLYRDNTIDKKELKRLVQGVAGAGIKCSGPIDQAFKAISMPSQPDMVAEANNVSSRIREHFGSNAFGTFPSSRRTGDEVQGSQNDSQIPVNRAGEKVRQLIVKMAKDISQMIFAFWTEDTVVDILSPVMDKQMNPETGQMELQDVTRQVWVSFKGQDLKGEFDYTMQPASGRFQDSFESKQEAVSLIQLFQNMPGADMQEVMRQLGDRFDSLDVEKIFRPVGGPGQPLGFNELAGQQREGRLALPQGS